MKNELVFDTSNVMTQPNKPAGLPARKMLARKMQEQARIGTAESNSREKRLAKPASLTRSASFESTGPESHLEPLVRAMLRDKEMANEIAARSVARANAAIQQYEEFRDLVATQGQGVITEEVLGKMSNDNAEQTVSRLREFATSSQNAEMRDRIDSLLFKLDCIASNTTDILKDVEMEAEAATELTPQHLLNLSDATWSPSSGTEDTSDDRFRPSLSSKSEEDTEEADKVGLDKALAGVNRTIASFQSRMHSVHLLYAEAQSCITDATPARVAQLALSLQKAEGHSKKAQTELKVIADRLHQTEQHAYRCEKIIEKKDEQIMNLQSKLNMRPLRRQPTDSRPNTVATSPLGSDDDEAVASTHFRTPREGFDSSAWHDLFSLTDLVESKGRLHRLTQSVSKFLEECAVYSTPQLRQELRNNEDFLGADFRTESGLETRSVPFGLRSHLALAIQHVFGLSLSELLELNGHYCGEGSGGDGSGKSSNGSFGTGHSPEYFALRAKDRKDQLGKHINALYNRLYIRTKALRAMESLFRSQNEQLTQFQAFVKALRSTLLIRSMGGSSNQTETPCDPVAYLPAVPSAMPAIAVTAAGSNDDGGEDDSRDFNCISDFCVENGIPQLLDALEPFTASTPKKQRPLTSDGKEMSAESLKAVFEKAQTELQLEKDARIRMSRRHAKEMIEMQRKFLNLLVPHSSEPDDAQNFKARVEEAAQSIQGRIDEITEGLENEEQEEEETGPKTSVAEGKQPFKKPPPLDLNAAEQGHSNTSLQTPRSVYFALSPSNKKQLKNRKKDKDKERQLSKMSPRHPHGSKSSPSSILGRTKLRIKTKRTSAASGSVEIESDEEETMSEKESESESENEKAEQVEFGDGSLEDYLKQAMNLVGGGTSEQDDAPPPGYQRGEWRGVIDEEKRPQKLTDLERQLLAENRALKAQLESVCRKAAQGTKMFSGLLEEDRALGVKESKATTIHADALKELRTLQAQVQSMEDPPPALQDAVVAQTDVVSTLKHRLGKLLKRRESIQKTIETLMAKAPTAVLPSQLPHFRPHFDPKSGPQPPPSRGHLSTEEPQQKQQPSPTVMDAAKRPLLSRCSSFVFPLTFDPFHGNQQASPQTYRSPVRRPNPHVVLAPKDASPPFISLSAPIPTSSPRLQQGGTSSEPIELTVPNLTLTTAATGEEQSPRPLTASRSPPVLQLQVPPLPKSVDALSPVPPFEPRMSFQSPSTPSSLFPAGSLRPSFSATPTTPTSPHIPPLHLSPKDSLTAAPLPPLLTGRLTPRSAQRRPAQESARRSCSMDDLENFGANTAEPSPSLVPTLTIASIPELPIFSNLDAPLSVSRSLPAPPSSARHSARPLSRNRSRSITPSLINLGEFGETSSPLSANVAASSSMLGRNTQKFLTADPDLLSPPRSAGGRLEKNNKFPRINSANRLEL